jgi:hypothetical protein
VKVALLQALGCMLLSVAVSTAWGRAIGPGGPGLAWKDFLATETQLEPAVSLPFERCFRRAAAAHDLPISLLAAIARGESNFNPDAVSSANARGLMQILWPGTGRHLGFSRVRELHEPCRNVEAGARYLKELLQRYDGDLHRALAAYNYGPGRIGKDGDPIPEGARWYSAYIYRHLRYVLGDGRTGQPAGVPVTDGQMEVAVFGAPYRAESFVAVLEERVPELRLDWFRQDVGRFRVVMLFDSREEYDSGVRHLTMAGFPLAGRRR